ncbi:type I glyceraldehyde-3-phosphate dehydrogenase [Lactobacillus agrestimuris]|uniref:type I glyceraldehyde-3-phosphate dehydrogenase n=1 Tax=Lactobacillus agrestimuris TaxID=2941328 RepID=UPI0020445971|nr:type I glyceraldehyde-3-phosphate dehydrogenase [Lactobacillus agrestimuris]
MVKIGINGFGRIGRLTLRRILEVNNDNLDVVAINDLTSPKMLAHLFKYDTVHGTFDGEVSADDNAIYVNGKKIIVYAYRDAKDIPWAKNDDVEIVVESTGFYTSKEKSQAHLDAGAKKVLISAPAGNMKTIVFNINDNTLTADDNIISAGSCTTNSLAPLAYYLNKDFGIKAGTMTTIHAYTSTQKLHDGPDRGNNFRNARAAAENTIPHSTGAAKAIGLVIPELDGKLKGTAQRVPVSDGSETILVTVLDKKVTEKEVNAAMKKYTENNDSFGYNADELVSSDVVGTTFGGIFDPTQTEVTDAGGVQLVKTVSWYDNEGGFVAQMVRTLNKLASLTK